MGSGDEKQSTPSHDTSMNEDKHEGGEGNLEGERGREKEIERECEIGRDSVRKRVCDIGRERVGRE